jgi:hypothetical protein
MHPHAYNVLMPTAVAAIFPKRKFRVREWISYFYSISRQRTDFFARFLFLRPFLNVLSFPHFDLLVWHSILLLEFLFLPYDWRTVICLLLAGVENDLAENFPREPLDGRCLHKSSWEIIVTCCLGPMQEKWMYSWKFSHLLLFSSILSVICSFCVLFFILLWLRHDDMK